MAKIVHIRGLASGLGVLTLKMFFSEGNASYVDSGVGMNRDTQQNGAAETATEETNKKGQYRATGITNGAGGDLSGPMHCVVVDASANVLGICYGNMSDAQPIIFTAEDSVRQTVDGAKLLDYNGICRVAGSPTASQVQLGTDASSINDFYNGAVVKIIGNTGVGQERRINSYVGSTRIATLDAAWVTPPDGTSAVFVLGRIIT